MTNRADLEALAVRCEQATGADRLIDCAVIKAIHGVNPYPVSEKLRGPGVWEYYLDDGPIEFVPPFTASLDAALTLAGSDAVSVLLDAISACQEDSVSDWVKALPRFVSAAALRAHAATKGETDDR